MPGWCSTDGRRRGGTVSDQRKTKAQLLEELTQLRERVAQLERPTGHRAHPEEALRREKAFLDELFNSAPEAVVLVDNAGIVLRANEYFTTLFGYRREEVIGQSIDQLVAPGDMQLEAAGYTSQVARGERIAVETVRRRKDGSLVDVSILGVPIRVGQGQVAVYGIYRGIGEQKRAERALRESEERYRTLFENAPIGLGVADAHGNLLAFNQAILDPGGWTRDEVREFGNVAELYADPEERMRVLELARRQGFVRREEVRFRRQDGSAYDALLSLTPITVEGRSGWHAMVEDITERKHAEETLVREKQFSDITLDSLPGIFYLMDEQGRLLRWNNNLLKFTGYSEEELKGLSPLDFFREEERPRIERSLREVFAAGFATVEAHLVAKDGSRVPYVFTALRTTLAGKQCIVGTAINITERRRVEDELRRSEAVYRALVDHAPYGIYLSSLDSKLLSVNPALVDMLGYRSEQELLGVSVQEELCAEPEAGDALSARLREGEPVDGVEMEWRRKDGRRVTVRLSGRPVHGDGGEFEGYQMIAEDVTERRVLEAQLRQAQKMEAIGQLTGGIAHDFNNVLTVILANADLVVSALPRELTQARADLEDIQGAARRGTTLIRKLLGFSRRERLELQPTDLTQLMQDLSAMLRRVVPENIEIQLLAAEPDAVAAADPGAIEQIVLNLATNSRDAMPDGGILRIETSRTWLDEGMRVLFTARTHTQAERLARILADHEVPVSTKIGPFDGGVLSAPPRGVAEVRIGGLGSGFLLATEALCVITEEEVFGSRAHRRTRRRSRGETARPFLEDLRELQVGDYVVHIDHGIGRYLGLERKVLGQSQYERMLGREPPSVEVLVVEYTAGDRLFLPVPRLNQIQKLAGKEGHQPKLDRLGGQTFARTKAKVQKRVRILAGSFPRDHRSLPHFPHRSHDPAGAGCGKGDLRVL